MVSSGVWSVLEVVWLLEEAVRRPLLGLCKRKDLRKRVVPQRDDAGHDVSLATHSKCVKGNVIRSGTLGRISVDTNAHGGARGTGLDMHQCRKEASRAFPGGLGNWGKHPGMAREQDSVELGAKLCGTACAKWEAVGGAGPRVPKKAPEQEDFV